MIRAVFFFFSDWLESFHVRFILWVLKVFEAATWLVVVVARNARDKLGKGIIKVTGDERPTTGFLEYCFYGKNVWIGIGVSRGVGGLELIFWNRRNLAYDRSQTFFSVVNLQQKLQFDHIREVFRENQLFRINTPQPAKLIWTNL